MAKAPEKSLPANSVDLGSGSDPLAEELAKRVGALVPPSQRSQVVAQVVALMKEEKFSGPIAHPKHLREYEQIVPGSGDRIISMAEQDLRHGHALQNRALEADVADMREGRRLGFAALLILIVGAIACGMMGKDAIAFALLGASVIGTIGTLIKGRGNGAAG